MATSALSLWQVISAAQDLSLRAIEEVRALARLPGPKGDKGEDGRPGKDGEPGERGAEGPPGKLPRVKEWADGIHYEGAVVARNGSTFQARKDTAKEPPHEDWQPIAIRGEDGVGLEIRGTYNPDDKYRHLDIVTLNASSFASRKDNPGVCPGPDWQLIAGQGKRGDRGPDGQRGLQGPKGEPGKDGVFPADLRIGRDGMLILTMSDGSKLTADFLPVLDRYFQANVER